MAEASFSAWPRRFATAPTRCKFDDQVRGSNPIKATPVVVPAVQLGEFKIGRSSAQNFLEFSRSFCRIS
jgi:hypothetical protein